jgi:glycosyltransferase involved in cell wall biosynthesis
MKKILFIVPFPKHVYPSERFRIELYENYLREQGVDFDIAHFWDYKAWNVLYTNGMFFQKVSALMKGLFRRTATLFTVSRYDYIFIMREVSPAGPPLFEWLIAKIFQKKIIYDFDDAIWIPHRSDHNNYALTFKFLGKVKSICRWSYKISCGNQYLCNYAKQFNKNVVYNPTCVDTEQHHNITTNHDVKKITIGWTGSFSTLRYLEPMVPVLSRLQEKYDFDIKVICNKRPSFHIRNLIYVEWTEQNEVTELAGCQIGLMPLIKDEWTEGKCGFKLIQYLALGIPAVSSPVGVNKTIVDHNLNGFLCETDQQWYDAIETLILDASLRKRMGESGRKKIIDKYSLESNKANFLGLFQ